MAIRAPDGANKMNNEREDIKLTIFFGKLSKTVKITIATLILSNLLIGYPSYDLIINKNSGRNPKHFLAKQFNFGISNS